MTDKTSPMHTTGPSGHPAIRVSYAAHAKLGDVVVPVTVVERECTVTKQRWTNAKDHCWRAEARTKINTALGQDLDTRLSGVLLLRSDENAAPTAPTAP